MLAFPTIRIPSIQYCMFKLQKKYQIDVDFLQGGYALSPMQNDSAMICHQVQMLCLRS